MMCGASQESGAGELPRRLNILTDNPPNSNMIGSDVFLLGISLCLSEGMYSCCSPSVWHTMGTVNYC